MDECQDRSSSRFHSWTIVIFNIYINDLADGLSSNTKLFADDTSLFSVIHDQVITI